MPIAELSVVQALAETDVSSLVAAWSAEAGVDDTHMTVNVASVVQVGVPKAVIARLYLPTLWSQAQVDALQVGLARACAEVFGVDADGVQVLTFLLPSGRVVEGGAVERWG